MKICNVENCNNNVWSGGKCKLHIVKKPLSSGRGFITKKPVSQNKIIKNNEHAEKLKEFFINVWDKNEHYSEVSGTFLGNNFSTIYMHHILEKRNFPEACFDKENIVFLTAEEHASVELDKFKYEYINNKRNQLILKYERT